MSETTQQPSPSGLRALTALSTWGALWRSGSCAPDDVLDSLSDTALHHRVVAADHRAAETFSLGGAQAGAGGLLGVLRASDRLRLVLPAPGATYGIKPSPVLDQALDAGEIMVIWPRDELDDNAFGLLARPAGLDTIVWTLHDLGAVPPIVVDSLAATEYSLREGIRDAATLFASLGSIEVGGRDSGTDLRLRLAALTQRAGVELPPQSEDRVVRVMTQATQVAAIVDLVAERAPTFGLTSATQSSADHAAEQLRGLARVARMTAVNTLLSIADDLQG
ncbi:hypothetical protein [Williamsia sp. CHRR-6]|uniref:hypothetical protein n=1 Tax=Williamsia sp. CHRR-6 TaxID=2835871 RepID=UPI001BD92CFD|nr:hypothetical protein [Williamsia sp. CHRR-6]MBT0568071.1 hypothetical protein [Williamsia sp. CHRR-6]